MRYSNGVPEVVREEVVCPSRSFAILFREFRKKTPDPDRPGKMLTQKRAAEILEISIQSIRFYEQDKRIPHPIIRRQIFNLWPEMLLQSDTI